MFRLVWRDGIMVKIVRGIQKIQSLVIPLWNYNHKSKVTSSTCLNAIDGADRVVIHKFHNGGKYHTGVSTQKMKLVYEGSKI